MEGIVCHKGCKIVIILDAAVVIQIYTVSAKMLGDFQKGLVKLFQSFHVSIGDSLGQQGETVDLRIRIAHGSFVEHDCVGLRCCRGCSIGVAGFCFGDQ